MNQEAIEPQPQWSSQDAAQGQRLIHLALPVRLIHKQSGERDAAEFACTYDIHPRGARLLSSREVKVGDMVTVERGRNKSICRVVWTADPHSALRGQFTVECVEGGKTPWEEELRQMKEQYLASGPRELEPEICNEFASTATLTTAGARPDSWSKVKRIFRRLAASPV